MCFVTKKQHETTRDNLYAQIEITVERIKKLEARVAALENPTDPPSPLGPFAWVITNYSDREFPWPTANNPHGNEKAVWKVTDDYATVFLPVNQLPEKPQFQENSGIKVNYGGYIYGWRKVLSGSEADGGNYICTLDPALGAVPSWKVDLVGNINAEGYLVDDDGVLIT